MSRNGQALISYFLACDTMDISDANTANKSLDFLRTHATPGSDKLASMSPATEGSSSQGIRGEKHRAEFCTFNFCFRH